MTGEKKKPRGYKPGFCLMRVAEVHGNRTHLALIFHETSSRDREDGRATGQPQGLEPESYLNSTSEDSSTEDARGDGYIRCRSR